MAFAHEQQQALHLLHGIENGTLSTSNARSLLEQADPALVYFIISWLRSRYGGDHPAAEGVIGRIAELSVGQSVIAARMREGKVDPVVRWFEEDFEYRAFDAPAFIELIVEKLEG